MRIIQSSLKRILRSSRQISKTVTNFHPHSQPPSTHSIDNHIPTSFQWTLNNPLLSRSARILPNRKKFSPPISTQQKESSEEDIPEYETPPPRSPRFQKEGKNEKEEPFTAEDFQWDFEARMDPDLGRLAKQEAMDFLHYAAEQASGPLMDDPRNLRPPRALSENCELVELSNPWRQTVKVRKGFSAGDLIIRESPLLTISDDASDEAPLFLGRYKKEILKQNLGLKNSAMTAPSRYLHGLFAFAHSTPETKRKIMQLYSPDYPPMDPIGMSFIMFLLKRLEGDGHLKGMSLSLCVGILMRLMTHAILHDEKMSIIHEACGFIKHSCNPNCMVSFVQGDADVEVRALKDLKAGDEIFVSYTSELRYPRELRRQILNFVYHFDCECDRCKAVDDMRAMKCRECKDGLIFLDNRRTRSFCSKCRAEMDKKVREECVQEELRVEDFFIKLEEKLGRAAGEVIGLDQTKPNPMFDDRVADYVDLDEALRWKDSMEASGFSPRHWLVMLMDLVLLEVYKEKRDYAESARHVIRWLESMEGVCPSPAVNKAMMYEELGDELTSKPELIGGSEVKRVLEMAVRSYVRAKENVRIMFGKDHGWFLDVALKLEKAQKKMEDAVKTK